MRRLFDLKAFNGVSSSNGGRSRNRSIPFATTYSNSKLRTTETSQGDFVGGPKSRPGDASWWERNNGGLSRSESEEYIVGGSRKDVPLEIWESRQVDVETGTMGHPRGTDLKKQQVKIYDGTGVRGPSEFESTTTIQAAARPDMVARRSESGDRK